LLRKSVGLLKRQGRESAYVDCLLVLSKILGKSKEYIIAHPEDTLDANQHALFLSQLERLASGEPVAYIVGEKEFFDHTFICTPKCLIPRPETELLVEKAQEIFGAKPPSMLMDLGTGTGAIGITLASIWPEAKVILTDIDVDVLLVARDNCKGILGKREHVYLICSNWFSALKEGLGLDLIVANPPYVSQADFNKLDKNVAKFEPERALFARDDSGLSEIEILLAQAPGYLSPDGVILVEVGEGQAEMAVRVADAQGAYGKIEVFKDLAGIDRVVAAFMSP